MTTLQANSVFPQSGDSEDTIRSRLVDARANDIEWFSLKNLTASYYGGEDVARIGKDAFSQHIGDNVVHQRGLHPSVAKYEEDVLAMTLELFQAPRGATGTVTTGGSESIALALLAAREKARVEKGITNPQMVIPQTAYAVFNKLCHFMGIEVAQIDHSVDYAADPKAMEAKITPDTIMLVGSAPPFPHGNVDPIEEIAAIANRNGIWMHVDACIGGFMLPFARMLGESVPAFDFSVTGVTSISSDYHKYGYAYRGCSALLLRDASLKEWQTFRTDAWPAGSYASSNMAGSRNSGPVASAWAVMNYLGVAGYKRITAKIIECRTAFREALEQIPGVHVLGAPQGPTLAFTIKGADIVAVANGLMELGWGLNIETKPAAILLMFSLHHAPSAQPFAADLRKVLDKTGTSGADTDDEKGTYGIY